ncbi:MAG TPA: PSD1 and planctomycete cytochrome C domain-containing protein [Gemmataceae bacterium]|nr:PSD1 and planctomycete cytochrome C domain-containing protein [Gemmataceae bacterium]
MVTTASGRKIKSLHPTYRRRGSARGAVTSGVCVAVLMVILAGAAAAAEKPVAADHAANMAASQQLFTHTVRPWLEKNCLACHGGAKVKSDFNLATRELLLKGGDKGVAVLPGRGANSSLVKFIRHDAKPHMPPKKPAASADIVAAVTRWIDLGAAYDKPLGAVAAAKKPLTVTEKDKEYWAYRPLHRVALPAVKDAARVRTPLDRFLLARMEARGVKPAAEAGRRTLVRRLYFDLIGLPPAPEEVEAVVAAPDFDKAWEALVDRLLASPHFGERWARHWLDPARFAESHGFEHDYPRPFAYHYRDFVIRAFNRDMPYDQFVRWQIAGDELAPKDPAALAATGFLGAGVFPTQITTSEAERIRYDALDDMLATTGYTMLALTVACARCHDHKYDPIPTRDYYRMLSAFTTTVRSEIEWDFGTEAERKAARDFETRLQPLVAERKRIEEKELPNRFAAWIAEQRARHVPVPKVEAKLRPLLQGLWHRSRTFDKLDAKTRTQLLTWFAPRDDEWKKRDAAVRELEKQRPKLTRVKMQICTEGLKPMRKHTADASIPDFYPQTYYLKRGDVNQKDGAAESGFLQVLMRCPDGAAHWATPKPKEARTSFRRAALAKWLTDTRYGAGALAARVIVNRLWHHHFGRGIVATINDFGLQGEMPTHPELLEWLANDLVEHGWSLKRLHRTIVLSQAYRLSGATHAAGMKTDPDNHLWWRRPRRRLEAEIIRDNLLAVGGRLDPAMFGPGTLDEDMRRRSIYFTVQRSKLIPFLQVFDWPDSLTSAGARPTTVVAPQALLFLNNPQVRACAAGFAERLLPTAQNSLSEAVARAYRLAFARPPSPREREEGTAFLSERRAASCESLKRALSEYALVLLSLNEFIYVD